MVGDGGASNQVIVIRETGEVYGADITRNAGGAHNIGFIYQFAGGKFGFGPTDRFVCRGGNILYVVNEAGDVWKADIDALRPELGPMSPCGGDKSGYSEEGPINPDVRFRVFMPERLMLFAIRENGDVWGTKIGGRTYQLGGGKIGYAPEDRFMLAAGDTLLVIKSDGEVWAADVSGLFEGAGEVGDVYQLAGEKIGYGPNDRFMVTIRSPIS
jgi:hypothetical protein